MFTTRKDYIYILNKLQKDIFSKLKKCWGFHPWPIIQIQVGYFLHLIFSEKHKEKDFVSHKRTYYCYKIKILDIYRITKKWISIQLFKKNWISFLKNKVLIVTWKTHGIVNGENIYSAPFQRLLNVVGREYEILFSDNCTVAECKLKILYEKLFAYNTLLFNIKNTFFKQNINQVQRISYLVEKYFEKNDMVFSKKVADIVYWNIIDNQIKYNTFLSFLKITDPQLIWLYVYYNNDSLSWIRASKAKKIKVLEYQHSSFNNDHFAYTKWDNIDEYSEYFPTTFWVWNTNSEEIIRNNFQGKKYTPQCLIGGNLYVKEQKEKLKPQIVKRDENKILVCLQGRWIPKFIEDFIIDNRDYFWYFRLHPRYPEDKNKLEILKKKIPEQIEIDIANSMPLYDLFLMVKYNLTSFSGTAFEAFEFGVINIIFGEDGYAMYDQQIADGSYKYVSTAKELKAILDSSLSPNYFSTMQADDGELIDKLLMNK